MKPSLLFASLLILNPLTSAWSAVVVELSATAPGSAAISHPLIAGGTEGNTSAYYRYNPQPTDTAYRSAGQAFRVAESFTMGAITWQVLNFAAGVPGKAFTIDIYEVNGLTNAATNSPGSGKLLDKQAGVLPATLDVAKPFYTFTLERPIAFTGGKDYAVVFSFTEPTSATTAVGHLQFVTVGNSDSVLSPAPRRWLDQGGDWVTIAKNQQIFYVHAVPEPSVAVLAVGALALAGAVLKRRRG